MLGLVVAAAIFAPVLIAVDSVSATTLCKVQETPCLGEKRWAGPTLAAKATNAQFRTSVTTAISCTESVISSQFTGLSGTPFTSSVKSLTFVGCTYSGGGGVNCGNGTVERLPYTGLLEYVAAWSGNYKIETGGSGEPAVKFVCGTSIECQFSAKPEVTVTGGSPGTILANAFGFNLNGKNCPAEAAWSGTYSASSPNPFYVAG
jgi:hypothetical protein